MSRLSLLAVSKRSVTLLLAAALFVAGVSSWTSLKQELLPDIAFPVITVVAPYPGAGAADVGAQVAEPIERAISGVPRLESLQSTSANSIAVVVAQFSFGTDVKEVQGLIEDNLAGSGLPDAVEPQVQALNINASPVIVAAIAATDADGLQALAAIARDEILPQITGLEGVAGADLTGGLEQQLLVTLDPAKVADAGLTVQGITGILQANNLTFPSGQVPGGGTKVPVSTTGKFDSVDDIRDLVVGYRMPAPAPVPSAAAPSSGASADPGASVAPTASPAPAAPEPVTLGELGSVDLADVPVTGYARTNG